MLNKFFYFSTGIVFAVLLFRVFPQASPAYETGQDELMIEAYENGLAERYVNDQTTFSYRWIETHKLGYEN